MKEIFKKIATVIVMIVAHLFAFVALLLEGATWAFYGITELLSGLAINIILEPKPRKKKNSEEKPT